jgi:tight adherence protein C
VNPAATGALLGLLGGTALVYSLGRLPPMRRLTLAERIAPYVRDTVAALDRPHPLRRGPLAALYGPLLDDLARRLDRFLGGREALTRRLERAGGELTIDEFRGRQVLAGAVGGLLGAVLLALRLTVDLGPPPLFGAALVLAGCIAGIVGRDVWLSSRIRRRETAMVGEFPAVAELLALAVGAGESPLAALERVTRTSAGALSGELRRALADARAGAPLVSALDGVASRTALPVLIRFVDGMTVALERGTPLADVLRAQAGDVREAGKQALIEAGGRKEIAMMLPVVFLSLPVTVLFAAYPALVSLTFTG